MAVTPQATLLYRLQVIDLALAKGRTRLQQIDQTLGQDARIQGAQAAHKAATAAHSKAEGHARDLELEIKSLAEKIADTEKRLYSGEVTNPKELGDMQNEIESLKRRYVKLEDDNMEALIAVQDAQTATQAAQTALDEAMVVFEKSQSSLIAEKRRLENEATEGRAKRITAAAAVEAPTMTRYEALRPKKKGMAVALLQDGNCTVCGVEQTSSVVQQVRIGKTLIACASCERILAFP